MEVQWFILRKTIVFQGFRGITSFSKGVELFSTTGVKMLISIETYRTYNFPGGGGGPDPIPPLDPRMHPLLGFKAPFNYVETHCT